MPFVYLDYNATTPVDPDVTAAMQPFFSERFGNASSLHAAGRKARAGLESARRTVLEALGDPSGRLLFTSGGTEADNLALIGAAEQRQADGRRVIVSAIEHHAVLHAADVLARRGWTVTRVPVTSDGLVDLEALRRALLPGTTLVSIMHANNEVGTLQPIAEIAALAHAAGAWLHTDAVQSFGKVPVSVRALGADLLSLSAHKLYGPKGSGALYLRRGVTVAPQHVGGPHEHGLRAGTEAVAACVGMARAVELAVARRPAWEEIARRRDTLVTGLQQRVPDTVLNGSPDARVPNTANLGFLGCEGEPLLIALDLEGIAVSTGAACSSGSTEPSHVLVAMGLPAGQVRGSIRFSLGLGTTDEEIAYVLDCVPVVVERLRSVQHAH
ncbi:MAG: hypothetical protein A3C53_05445 [Omnitrophica WOR_2 bacterium RIFCSPHIGHO2_02_FULL_68_15]|nr:MAG: hypothetical protein A3C53_05445 [Omnitrophica WOR_2 bacterium RIFCSPHIGHO2_02_FULL_68_15]